MLSLGHFHLLRVLRRDDTSIHLDAEEHGEAWMPIEDAPPDAVADSELNVFLYRHSREGLIATCKTPLAEADQFAALGIVGMSERGDAFLDWGVAGDLLLPASQQAGRVFTGDRVVVLVTADPKTGLMRATMRFRDHQPISPPEYDRGQPVTLLISHSTPLGWTTIINQSHQGLLHHNQAVGSLSPGEEVRGYISDVHPDGRIAVTMLSASRERVDQVADDIMAALKSNEGQLAFDDSSDPEVIRRFFGCSKRVFKQAAGALLREGSIEFTSPGIRIASRPKPSTPVQARHDYRR